MKRNGLTAELAGWLSKYARESWKYDDEHENVAVKGNITITDREMEKLPLNFSAVEGKFTCMNCSNLKSVKGMPLKMEEVLFENCLFPAEIYLNSIQSNCDIEEYLKKNFDTLSEEVIETIERVFPELHHAKRGKIVGKNFGF